MSETTGISWTDATWSPWEGCTKVSTAAAGGGGCDNCYAERMNRWLHRGENWGPGAPRLEFSADHWDKPIKWQRAATKFDTMHRRRRRVFPSMCDPFDNEVHETQRARFFGLIRLTPGLDWLVLTKRIGNAKSMLPADWGDGYPNVWLGATVVNQAEADRDIPKLLAVPARVRFLSIEPMLGAIDLQKSCTIRCPNGDCFPHGSGHRVVVDSENGGTLAECICSRLNGLHWVIAGGESGPKARPAHPDWFRSLRDQCAAAGVPFHFKQHGEWAPDPDDDRGATACGITRRGEVLKNNAAFNANANAGDAELMFRVGKKAAGRLLDGVEHNAFPEAAQERRAA